MIAGYCWPQSGAAGDAIDLMISAAGGSCRVEVLRIGADEIPVGSWEVSVTEQPVPDDCATEGCGWAPSLSLEVDPEWQPGFHLVRLLATDGEIAEAFFVVRAAEPGETLLVLSASTWAAYNDWGGPSFYTGGHESSQQRPLPRGFLDKPDPHRYRVARFGQLPRAEADDYFDNYSYWSSAAGWANWERLFVSWAERNGVSLDYATSLDLHTQPDLLDGRRLYLSVGHDEYWWAQMRDEVESWVEAGGAVAFFSGNTSFWQIRFGDDDRVIGYKLDFHLDPVMGTAPAHLWETSEAPPGLPDSYVGELNWVTERLGGGDTPQNRERFAYGAAVMGWFRRGLGEVFTTGCTDWAYGLEHDDVATVTRNVIGRYVDLADDKPGSPS